MHARADALARLDSGPHDLLVIGGGIVGAGIAAEAARAGLRVALIDRGDFGGATSSASSKLIHGGLRYLRMGDVALVREAHRERHLLLQTVAPHLVQPLPFLLPVYRDGPHREHVVRLGLWGYRTLARENAGGWIGSARAQATVPALRTDGLRGCGVYRDAWTHDSRLCLANVTAAARAGATVLNHAEAVSLRVVAGRVRGAEIHDRLGGATVTAEARAVVNATGPWLERLRLLEDPAAAPYGRLSKGVHVLLPLETPWAGALTIPQDASRVTFAYPWLGTLLLGTTDTRFDGDPDDVRATDADLAQVLDEAGAAVDPSFLRRDRVLSFWAGLRVLPGTTGATPDARRETTYLEGRGGMLTVAGGKLTTYRQIAHGALTRLAPVLGRRMVPLRAVPLPGAADAGPIAARLTVAEGLEPAVAHHLATLYGSEAFRVVALAAHDASLLEPIAAGGPDIRAQVVYAAREEWAMTTDDALMRRTTVAARGLADTHARAVVEALLVVA